MCGIAGTLELGGGATETVILDRMARAISHRGPDGCRADVTDGAGLAHARLRVIDLSEAADQPMWNEDRSVGIVYNGEIYNFLSLRRELEREGFRFRTRSDTEVILRLYEHLQLDAFSRLDGMFAIAIWDVRRRRLILARDRAGKKPLFFYQDRTRFAFASEIKALHAHPEISREPLVEALPLYLSYGYFPAPLTAYAHIEKLAPATWMTIDTRGERHQHRYWAPPHLSNGTRSQTEAEEKLRALLDRAVEKRLVSDVPLGALLSGGLDSTLVVGLMSRHSSSPVKTFSVGFRGAPEFDETKYAELAARTFATDHTTFLVGPPDGEFLERLVHFHDGPFGDSSAIPTYLVSRLVREHVTVVLNGDGGDELFAGYSRFPRALGAERVPPWLRACGRGLSRAVPPLGSWWSPLRRMKRFLELSALPAEEKFRVLSSIFPNSARELSVPIRDPAEAESAIAEHFQALLNEVSDGTTLSRLLYLNFRTYLAEDLLVKMDRSTMAHGLEARSPFLDTALVEFAGRLPDDFKLRGSTTKYLLRETFKELAPEPIRARSKMGFSVPLGAWLRGPLRSYLTAQLDSPPSRVRDFLHEDVVSAHLNAHLGGQRDLGDRLFCLLTLEIWLRSF